MYTAPTVANFQAQFLRDFPYSNDINAGVTPTDIVNAFNMVDITINQNLWGTQTAYNLGYLLLAAHFLCLNLRAASQGMNGQYGWLQNSKSVGSVSESFTIPQRLIDNPDFSQYFKTNYGAQYMQLVWPLLAGQMFTVCGRTKP